MFVATYIIGTVKMRSKRSIHRHPALEPSVYEMIETDQKAIDVKTNSAYETVTEKGAVVLIFSTVILMCDNLAFQYGILYYGVQYMFLLVTFPPLT